MLVTAATTGEGRVMTVLDRASQTFNPRRGHGGRSRRDPAGAWTHQERAGVTQLRRVALGHVTEHLTLAMQQLIHDSEMVFIATSGSSGTCDCSFRVGPAGFIRILNYRTIAYPEYGGSAVATRLDNIRQNPYVGLFMVDCAHDLVGLHVNGMARIVTPAQMREFDLDLGGPGRSGLRTVRWVVVRVSESYLHCAVCTSAVAPSGV
jgi:predicted pyridoxine 5'-phosphate oxidase superfamily flavin-nucleotide-binding protein